MDTTARVELWRSLLHDPLRRKKSWVLYEHGTCVVVLEPEGRLVEQATALLREFGPVYDTEAGDFDVYELDDLGDGWLVVGPCPDVLVHVSSAELGGEAGMRDLAVALCGRSKRHRDSTEPVAVHAEDGRLPGERR